MKERQKILELLQEGKISVEQADLLIAAIEERTANTQTTRSEKNPLEDLKNMGSQVSSTIAQSLTELRRNVEQQWENWSPFGMSPSVLSTTELNLAESIENLSVETTNGEIQVVTWDQPYARLYIRGRVKADSVLEGKRLLNQSLQITQTDTNYELVVVQGGKDGVSQATVDVYVPNTLKHLSLHSQNGHLQLDAVALGDLQAETVNGSVSLSRVKTERIRVVTQNGNVNMYSSISPDTRNVYVFAKNGTIDIKGIDATVPLTGTAKTSLGRVDIAGEGWVVEYDDAVRKRSARFEQVPSYAEPGMENTTRIFLETKHGGINIRA